MEVAVVVQRWTVRQSVLFLGVLALVAQRGTADVGRARGGTLELRPEANVIVGDVKLKQLCRWGEDDNATFAAVADLVVARVDEGKPFVSVKLDDVRAILEGAGMNAAAVRFTGAAACTVSRADVNVDTATAFNDWARTQEQSKAASRPVPEVFGTTTAPTGQPLPATPQGAKPADNQGSAAIRTLREQLVTELATRLQLPAEALQMAFDPRDEKVLALTNPPFKFQILPRKFRNLGSVNWDVVVITGAGEQKMNISAVARAWQDQVVAARPIAFKQILRAEDVEEKRVLVDTLADAPPPARSQVVGQQASLELKIGAVLTANSVDSVPLVRTGQLVTVTVSQGAVSIKTAARAMDSATYGQPVKLRNEITKDVFEAIVTGQQEASVGSPTVGG
jgi:flagella basal body P-ring formation protein FlgA